jgi:Protein of unknown function (DUF3179)
MRRSRVLVAVLTVFLLLSVVCVAYPIFVIRPFRAQGPAELGIALVVSRFRPAVTLASALASIGCLILYWREERRKWPRVGAAAASFLVLVMAFLARVNVYEIMFHPIGRPSFADTSDAKLDNDEKVIAVKIGAVARAYPIRGLSYHHIANDVVDKTAIVATY